MANPDIQLMGATYQAVSGVTLPVAGGGTATFPFVEGSQTITTNNTYDVTSLAQVIVNVAGGGGSGLTYETGTYTPTEDTASATISFANSHSTRPIFTVIYDASSSTEAPSASSILYLSYVNWYDYDGTIIYTSSSSPLYGIQSNAYKTSTASTYGVKDITSLSSTSNSGLEYWLHTNGFYAYISSSRKFRSGHNYKWIAVWKP